MRVEKWQKDTQPEGTEAVSGMRDVPEAGQVTDATEVLPAARPFQVTGEAPATGTASTGPGTGWFGNADDAERRGTGAPGAGTRRPDEDPTRADAPRTADRPSPDAAETRLLAPDGSADADRTEILGGRIGQDRMAQGDIAREDIARGRTARERIAQDRTDRDGTQRRGSDPMIRGRITWGANQSGSVPGEAKPNRAHPAWTNPSPSNPSRTNSSPTNPNEADPAGANPSVAGPARKTPGGATPAAKQPNGANAGGPRPDSVHPTGANPDRRSPVDAAPHRPDPTGPARHTAAPDADRTDVLPPVTPATPRAPRTRTFPATVSGPASAAPDADRTDVLPPVTPATPRAPRTRAFPATPPGPATAALRDPWQDAPGADAGAAAAADHTHDPHEVTVQLDAVQLGDGVLRRADGPQSGKKGPEGSDGPVFVDASGRRSRLYRRLGIGVGVACAIYAVVIVSTLLSGNSNAPWLPVDGQQEGKPAGQVDTTPLPSRSAEPSGTGSAVPRTSPSPGAGATTAPGADAPAPGTSGSARQPGTSADPEPSQTSGGTEPGGGDGGATAPDPSQSTQESPPASTDPSPPAGGGEPTVDPTGPTVDPTTGTDPGGDMIANGASAPLPVVGAAGPASGSTVVAGPAASDTTRTSPHLSPENTL